MSRFLRGSILEIHTVRLCSVESSPDMERSTLHPDGWVGDQVELERARHYRMVVEWGTGLGWLILIAYLVVLFTSDSASLHLLFFVMMALNLGVVHFSQRRVSRLIGRKWTLRLELKERQRQDRLLQQREAEARGAVDTRLNQEQADDPDQDDGEDLSWT